MISITIAIQCEHFQRRLCCMLSSIHNQNDKEKKFHIVTDIAHSINNGKPTTEESIDFFKKLGMDIISRPYDSYDRYQYRGMTRSDQIADCKTDYMLFSDCDMVYHPNLFLYLTDVLVENEEYSNYNGVMTCGRYSQPNHTIEKSNIFVNNMFEEDKPKYIENIWDLSNKKLQKKSRRNVGAGYWQLINMELCDHGGYYVSDRSCRDRGWEGKGQKASSDRQFRKRIGIKKAMPEWFSKNQIHLNHNRDSMYQKHIKEQR
jgi:hypothetical protein